MIEKETIQDLRITLVMIDAELKKVKSDQHLLHYLIANANKIAKNLSSNIKQDENKNRMNKKFKLFVVNSTVFILAYEIEEAILVYKKSNHSKMNIESIEQIKDDTKIYIQSYLYNDSMLWWFELLDGAILIEETTAGKFFHNFYHSSTQIIECDI
ncbi:hypothetical protein [Chengkuizengella axinellae]|uniref:Uncharacterized protein n=1 Tax=Chengkuizengella axinellae TaxID=3064388 RepID=A0ABT9IWH8_9BACL|nr:hypothetical protein [Chengkuizengella sp. 2205SS18-9]MDP5273693.1 hypothetical protein [Chengkuizengella sp. 2205SS18-9]